MQLIIISYYIIFVFYYCIEYVFICLCYAINHFLSLALDVGLCSPPHTHTPLGTDCTFIHLSILHIHL